MPGSEPLKHYPAQHFESQSFMLHQIISRIRPTPPRGSLCGAESALSLAPVCPPLVLILQLPFSAPSLRPPLSSPSPLPSPPLPSPPSYRSSFRFRAVTLTQLLSRGKACCKRGVSQSGWLSLREGGRGGGRDGRTDGRMEDGASQQSDRGTEREVINTANYCISLQRMLSIMFSAADYNHIQCLCVCRQGPVTGAESREARKQTGRRQY